MSGLRTLAIAAGTFAAGFATSAMVGGHSPVEPTREEAPAPVAVEWSFDESGLTLLGDPDFGPRFFFPGSEEAPPVEATPSGHGMFVPLDEATRISIYGIEPLLFCTATTCKPCRGDADQCGAPPPPRLAAGGFYELRMCKTCDEENCIQPVGCSSEPDPALRTCETCDEENCIKPESCTP